MNKDEILWEVEELPFSQRFRYMVELGRASLADGELAMTLTVMAQEDFYERYLLLQTCFGSRNGDYVLQALTDPSRIIRRQALRLVPLACTIPQIGVALTAVSFEMHISLIRYLRASNIQAPIDAFLSTLAERGNSRLGALLPYGSPDVVNTHIRQVSQRFRLAHWRKLARHHPTIALDLLQQRIDAAEEFDQLLIQQVNTVLPILATSHPDTMVILVTNVARRLSLTLLDLQPLFDTRPNEVVDLFLATREPLTERLIHKIKRLTFDRVLQLAEQGYLSNTRYDLWLPELTSEQRKTLYTHYMSGWHDEDGALSASIVANLPQEMREQEGRRHWELPALVAVFQRVGYAAFLPWHEALDRLAFQLHHTEPATRGTALETLAETVRYQRQHLADLLTIFLKHENEPDIVHTMMFMGLNKIPCGSWETEHLNGLTQLIQTTLDSIDLSERSVHEINHFLIRLVPFHATWSAEQIALIMEKRGDFRFRSGFPRLSIEKYLTASQLRTVIPYIEPVLHNWEKHARIPALIDLGTSLGRLLQSYPEFIALLERCVQKTNEKALANTIVGLIIRWCPERAKVLIPIVLQNDPSWITVKSVCDYVQRQRQDLLTPFIIRETIQGRFSNEETRFILALKGGFWRWTRQQQNVFAKQQQARCMDSTLDRKTKTAAILRLAALPAIEQTELLKLANSTQRGRQRIALIALARLDADQGTSIMLEALKGERVRIAIYAFRRRILNLPERQAFDILQTIPLDHHTVTKEVIRLMGELHLEEAYQELRILASRDLHPDLHAAVLRALWNHLERPETWEILEGAIANLTPATISTIGRIPVELLTTVEQQRFLRLLEKLLDYPHAETRIELLERFQGLSINDVGQALTPKLLQLLRSPFKEEYKAAMNAFLAICTERDASLAQEVFEAIRTDRDCLTELIQLLHNQLDYSWRKKHWIYRRHFLIIQAMLVALASDPLAVTIRVELACKALALEEVVVFLRQMAQGDMFHAEALMQTCIILQEHATRPHPNDLVQIEVALADEADERLRRIALAALVAQTNTWNDSPWTPERVGRLHKFRADPSPLVAGAAQFVLAPE